MPGLNFKTVLAKAKRHGRPLARSGVRFVAHSSIPAILLSTSLLFSRYLPNSDYSYPSELILPVIIFAVLATAFFYLYKWSFKGNSFPAHVATFLLIYAVYGFNYAFPYIQKLTEAILPSSFTTSFSSAALRILLLGAFFWLVARSIDRLIRRAKPLRQLQPYKVLLFAVCFIFAVQAIKVADRLWDIRHQLAYQSQAALPAKPATPSTASSDKPNVYYLLFDRYASGETLQNVYNYDNSPTLDFLKGQGFVTRDQAYANYPFTQQSISSTLSMGYLSDLEQRFKDDAGSFQTAFPYRSIISDPPVAQIFKQNGYQYNQVSSWWDFSRVDVKADADPVKSFRLRILGMTFWLTDLERDIFYNSALSPILQKGITIGGATIIKYDLDRNQRQNFKDQMTAIQDLAVASADKRQPQFTFAHVLAPHDPYLFNADGSDAPYNGDRTDQDIDEYVKYTNQLTYANSRIQEVITTIRQEDPTAVIVFQPDEGPYPKEFRGRLTPTSYFDPKNLSDVSMRQKFGITASYYMPGIDPETVSRQLTSSVNAFPFIFNNYLGYDIKYLPECNFSSGNKYVLYDYSILTSRLHDQTSNTTCSQYDR